MGSSFEGQCFSVKKLGFPAVHQMKIWDELQINGMEIIHTPCHHWGARYVHDTHRDYGGYIVKAAGKSVFHCGDSTYFEGFTEIGKRHDIDIALMPIGAYESPSGRDVHMNPEQAVRAFADLGAKALIPMHYGTFPARKRGSRRTCGTPPERGGPAGNQRESGHSRRRCGHRVVSLRSRPFWQRSTLPSSPPM